ncbi:MAG TPA: hypothetical protein VFK89_00985 [Actinomycetota bacterium]|nr:hypothetical protein [Actinomycetota bacterium]
MRGVRLLIAGLIGAATFTVAVPAGPACAAEGRHAVLVVDTENEGGQYRYCVALPDDESVSAIDLIELAHDQYGLTYRLSYGGNAVCMLADVGTESDDCFSDYPDFWGYWEGDGSGGWTWASEAAAAAAVDDGDVQGWSWGSGSDGSTHPPPVETTYESVCEVTAPTPAEPEPAERRPQNGGPRESGSSRKLIPPRRGNSSGSSRSASGDSRRPQERDEGEPIRTDVVHRNGTPATTTTSPGSRPAPIESRAAAAREPAEAKPPIAGIVALLIVIVGGLLAFTLRRRAG